MFGDEGNFDSAASHLKYYGLDFANEDIKYVPVELKSNAYFLAGHIFEPKEYKSVVFVLHGFLSHCGLCRHIIGYLVRQGYAVASRRGLRIFHNTAMPCVILWMRFDPVWAGLII